MVEVGDKVYWVGFDRIRSGVIVKKSWLRGKVWIKIDGKNDVFDVPVGYIGSLYFLDKRQLIEKIISDLEFDLKMAKDKCRKISKIEEEIKFWKNMLEAESNV